MNKPKTNGKKILREELKDTFHNAFLNKVALVTGASTGIGRATALAFAIEGASVVLADINTDAAAETARLIEQTCDGSRAKVKLVKCDVSKSDDVRNLLNTTLDTYGKLDCAFNNAGIEGMQALTSDCSEENFDRVIATNLKGVFLCMKYEIPLMQKQVKKTGASCSIVNCASIAGLIGFPAIPAYTASKHGVIGLTKTAALEYAKSGIRINAVCPGAIQTPMLDRFINKDPQVEKFLSESSPIGRIGKPDEIANAVLWLCSDSASYVTGHPLVVDGGWVAK